MGQEMEISIQLISAKKYLYAYSISKCNLVFFKYHKYHIILGFHNQIFNFKNVELGVKFGI